MRHETQANDIRDFMRKLGVALRDEGRIYFTGGVSAVLHGWRQMTVDIAQCFEQIPPALLRYPAIDPESFVRKVASFITP